MPSATRAALYAEAAILAPRPLVLVIVALACLATLGNVLYVAYRLQHDAQVHFSLQPHLAYANKVATSIDEFLRSAQRTPAGPALPSGR